MIILKLGSENYQVLTSSQRCLFTAQIAKTVNLKNFQKMDRKEKDENRELLHSTSEKDSRKRRHRSPSRSRSRSRERSRHDPSKIKKVKDEPSVSSHREDGSHNRRTKDEKISSRADDSANGNLFDF